MTMSDDTTTTTNDENATSAPAKQKQKGAKSAAKQKQKSAPAKAKGATSGGARDALGGRLQARTNAIHLVLKNASAPLTTRQIEERATKLMQKWGGADNVCRATGAHLNTMKLREYIERKNGAYQLTKLARKLFTKGGATSDAANDAAE